MIVVFEVYYEYTEYISKNNLHHFTDCKDKNKVVRAYAMPDSERCLVKLLDPYSASLPFDSEYFHLWPCKCFPADPSKPAYIR